MNRFLPTLSLLASFALATSCAAAEAGERTVAPIRLEKGAGPTVVAGSIQGYRYVDYQLRAYAGQSMTVSMKGSNAASYFNLLPPDTSDAAMYVGSSGGNRFEGLLPDDGVYTLRVYLMRSAARRQETSRYTLSVGITGERLPAVSAKIDAVLPGTRYHAATTVRCEPAYTQTRECEAFVVRRGFDGTATVELRWDGNRRRRILFVKGEPKAADVPPPMTFVRDERGWKVRFDGDENFEVPEPLVFGG
jgi:hypothetical protein